MDEDDTPNDNIHRNWRNPGSNRGKSNQQNRHSTNDRGAHSGFNRGNWRNPGSNRGKSNQQNRHSTNDRGAHSAFNRGNLHRGTRFGPGTAIHQSQHARQLGMSVDQFNVSHRDTNRGSRTIRFKALHELTNVDPREIIGFINQRKEHFLNLIMSPIENTNSIIMIMKLLSKICQCPFDEIKLRYLLEVCNSPFVTNLRNRIMELPYEKPNCDNDMYFDNIDEFWHNFIIFCETIFNMAPTMALQKCRTLIEGTSKICLEEMNCRHNYILPEESNVKLCELRARLSIFEENEARYEFTYMQCWTPNTPAMDFNITLPDAARVCTEKIKQHKHTTIENKDEEPTENFRELSIVPTRDELVEEHRPFLRANIVEGGYRDVEHYLDVQFRLLREDCFGPLREGLRQYIENPNQRQYDNIRVYRNVRFAGLYVNKTKAGSLVQLDKNTMKQFTRVNWAHSKRFIYGSILFFTKDLCKSFTVATIMDRNIDYIKQGKIPISTIDYYVTDTPELLQNVEYVMIESEVYFEPYLHAMKALQHPRFPNILAMKKYIVDVNPTPNIPTYVNITTKYTVYTKYGEKKLQVMAPETWPSLEETGFNESQYDAYKLALTHEFSVIQGPPGTGKTYLGVQVAKTLLQNVSFTNVNQRCLMLIICYTNHALDQFLEHILTVTNSIVRIGGQSRNPAMEDISLNRLRMNCDKSRIIGNSSNAAHELFLSERYNLQDILGELQRAQDCIDSLSNGVIAFENIIKYIPEAENLKEKFWKRGFRGNDVLYIWLFENIPYITDAKILCAVKDYNEEDIILNANDEKDKRTSVIVDDLTEIDGHKINYGIKVKTSFMLQDAQRKLRQLVVHYNQNLNIGEKLKDEREIHQLNSRIQCFKRMKEEYSHSVPREYRPDENLYLLSNTDRWLLYFAWADTAINKIKEKIQPTAVEKAEKSYEEARMMFDFELIKNIKVIGMTTSGATRLCSLVQALKPPIVMVEEAAEVLEPHIVTSLTSSCKHLILIGDHQQLRPSTSYMKLAKCYNFEVSLFERMITNKMHSARLAVQHRMRPEIAALIAPHIYSDLANHPSVNAFPDVVGVTTNLFFYTHNYQEEVVADTSSRSNQQEAEMVLGLANYLIQQEYDSHDITILTPYTGQMFYMKQQRSKYPFLNKEVKITVVDNYQGEESRIILLSLVRNNIENKIGFLGTENRICVALSRAKEGLYIFGNIDILTQNSPLWQKLAKTLEEKNCIGSALVLKCKNHTNQISMISNVNDFGKVPEGGCLFKCNHNLPECGHQCPLICHGYDREHLKTKCQLKCERIICERSHVCPLKCNVKCQPCRVWVRKTLPCKHEQNVYCHQEPNDPSIKCNTTVVIKVPNCGHEAKKPCHLNIKRFVCPVRCFNRIEACGHECCRLCHVTNDPNHKKYLCKKPCARAKKGCSADLSGDLGYHQCLKICHESCEECNVKVLKKRSKCTHSERVLCSKDVNENPCRNNCARSLPCGHFCRKKCFEPCGDCQQKVTKPLPDCAHTIQIACQDEPKREMCKKPCKRMLSCGHLCKSRCDQICDASTCTEIIPTSFDSPCGHKVQLPCHVYTQLMSIEIAQLNKALIENCTEPCMATLKCKHLCSGSCSQCHQGRLHVPCIQKCHGTLICGHQCEEPCNRLCPPCKKPCEVKCFHSKCNKLCGAPCVMCQEKCERKCRHGACNRRCGEACERAACDEVCPLLLKCGHACRGLCGEPCPDICKICRPDAFPRDFLGDEFDDDTKFIQLQDCSHVLAVEDADNLMQGDSETVTIRSCPFCRKPIINTYRYKDIVNNLLKTEINPIKERVYGTPQQIEAKQIELKQSMATLEMDHVKVFKENDFLNEAYATVKNVVTRQKRMSGIQIDMHLVYINILTMLGEYYLKYHEKKLTALKEEFLEHIKMLCATLRVNIYKLSQQQQEDIKNELRRMNSIIQLAKILNHSSYLSVNTEPGVLAAVEEAKEAVISINIFDEVQAVNKLQKLEKDVKVRDIVTKAERDLIVQAMGFKQGHWFKCPNGHFYCIGECGGAMQTSRCIECGEAVGGTRHTLLSSNSLAHEMDGAQYAAWSEEYNNMANFDLNLD